MSGVLLSAEMARALTAKSSPPLKEVLYRIHVAANNGLSQIYHHPFGSDLQGELKSLGYEVKENSVDKNLIISW